MIHGVRRRVHGDQGVAIIASMGLVMVAMILITVMVGYAIATTRDTARDRQRALSVAGVESVIDETYAALQVADPYALPCSWPATGALDTRSLPERATGTARIQYVGKDGTVLNTLTGCLPAGYDASTIDAALITATGQTRGVTGAGPTKRRMESYVKLNAVLGNSLAKAVYGAAGVSFSNNSTVSGDRGLDADVYSGGNYTCDNSQTVDGNVYVQGTYTATNRCIVLGDVWARDGVLVRSGDASYGGRLMSTYNDVVVEKASVQVGGALLAGGTVTWQRCATNPGKCTSGAVLPPPPAEDFPVLVWDAPTQAEWMSKGYAVQVLHDCSLTDGGRTNAVGRWILDNASSLTKTVLVTDCQVFFKQSIASDVKLGGDLAIFARGGFVTENQVRFSSTVPGTTRQLYWIVPYDVAPRPCSSPPLTTSNGFWLSPDVSMLLYSPCDISFDNAGTMTGQVYGGSKVTLTNRTQLSFRALPVWGLKQPTRVSSYKVDIVYKREG